MGRENVKCLVQAGPRPPHDDRVTRDRRNCAQQERRHRADEAGRRRDTHAADDDRRGRADRCYLPAAAQVEQEQTTSVAAGASSVFVKARIPAGPSCSRYRR